MPNYSGGVLEAILIDSDFVMINGTLALNYDAYDKSPISEIVAQHVALDPISILNIPQHIVFQFRGQDFCRAHQLWTHRTLLRRRFTESELAKGFASRRFDDQSAFLSIGTMNNPTSPVIRRSLVKEILLNDPPPPNVPELDAGAEQDIAEKRDLFTTHADKATQLQAP